MFVSFVDLIDEAFLPLGGNSRLAIRLGRTFRVFSNRRITFKIRRYYVFKKRQSVARFLRMLADLESNC